MKKLLFIFSFASMTIITNAQWQQIGLNSEYINCLAAKGDTIVAGANFVNDIGNGVYLSTNNGNTWIGVNNGLPIDTFPFVRALAFKGDTIFAGLAGNDIGGGVYVSSNNGQLWTPVYKDLWNSVFALAIKGNSIFAGTEYGVYLSQNSGNSWAQVDSGLSGAYVMCLAIHANNIFAGTYGSGIYMSSNNGISWDTVNTGLTGYEIQVQAIVANDSNIFTSTGEESGVFRSTNNGTNWSAVNVDLPTNSLAGALTVKGDTIFTADDGVYISLNNGNNWIAWNYCFTDSNNANSFAINKNTIFAGTSYYGIWRRPLSQITGIKEINNNTGNIAVYPNPAANNITIKPLQKSTMDIIDIQGQTILQRQLQQGKTDIDISGLAKGVYILRLCSNDKTEVTKIVKE